MIDDFFQVDKDFLLINEFDEYDKRLSIRENNIFEYIFNITKDCDVSNLIISFLYEFKYRFNYFWNIKNISYDKHEKGKLLFE